MSIKSLGKQSLIYGLGHVLARVIMFVMLPVYTNVFNQEDYGALSLAYAFMGFALIIYRYGTDTAMLKYSVQEKGDDRIRYITIIILSQVITGALFSAVLILLKNDICYFILGSYQPDWVIYLALILYLDSLWNLPLLILRSEERALSFISISLINVITTMVLNIIFIIYLGFGVEGVFIANIFASGLVFIISIPLVYNRISFRLINRVALKELAKFALPFLPAGIFTMIMELSDRYLIEYILGTSDVGIYSAGKKMGMLGLTVVMAFNMGWYPYFLRRGKDKNAKTEFAGIASIFLGIIGYISLLVTLWISEIMRIPLMGKTLIGSEFWSCEPVVGTVLIGYYFFGIYIIQLPGVYLKGITHWVPFFRISGAITLIVSGIFLIPIFGFIGAAYSALLGYIVMGVSTYIKTHRLYPVPYNYRAILFPIFFLICSQISPNITILNIVLSVLYPLMWYNFAINFEEKNSIIRLFK